MATALTAYATQPMGQPGTPFGAGVATLASLAATVPPAGTSTVYLYAILDGEYRARIFNSLHSSYVLPFISWMYQQPDPQGVGDGPWILELTPSVPPLPSTGLSPFNPDAGSPMNFLLDQYCILLVTTGSGTPGDPTT